MASLDQVLIKLPLSTDIPLGGQRRDLTAGYLHWDNMQETEINVKIVTIKRVLSGKKRCGTHFEQ